MICAIILAAGESKRMGAPKQLLPFGKSTIIETVVKQISQSKVDHIIVVLGHAWEQIAAKLASLPVEITINPHYQKGMLSSVQWGLKTIENQKQYKAVLIALADQPAIPTSVINRLIQAFHRRGKGIALPVYQGERGHPVLIDLKYRQEIMELQNTIGLRGLMQAHPDDVLEVSVNTDSILRDIDDLQTYQREFNLAKRSLFGPH